LDAHEAADSVPLGTLRREQKIVLQEDAEAAEEEEEAELTFSIHHLYTSPSPHYASPHLP
jgi:hypothetical protein